MSNIPSDDQIRASLPRLKRGLLMVAKERERLARRDSPRGKAGHFGGLITSRLYPTNGRPRDASGRFLPGPLPPEPAKRRRRIADHVPER